MRRTVWIDFYRKVAVVMRGSEPICEICSSFYIRNKAKIRK